MVSIIVLIFMMLNYYGIECGTSLRFCESKGWIRPIDPYGWFQWYWRYYFSFIIKNELLLKNQRKIILKSTR